MKECNIPFCKEIPDGWKEVPNKYLFEYHSMKVGDKWKDYQLLSLTTNGVKEKDINASGGKVPDSYDKYQTVEPGDMIFCLFDLDVSAVFSGLSHHYGMITSAYEVVRPNHRILDQNFSDFWFQYVFTNRYYKMYSKNIRFTIGSDMFKSIATPIPPMDQQRKIAGFLNQKTSEIDFLIEIENQQIEKLKEYKQAVITEVILNNCDEKWKIKYLSSGIADGTHGSYERVQNGHYLLSAKNLGEDDIRIGNNESQISNTDFNEIVKNGFPRKNDILMCAVGDIGKTILYMYDEPYAFQRSVMFIRPNNLIVPKFLLLCLKTKYVKDQEIKAMNKTIQAGLYQGLIKEIFVPFTRSIEIQNKIVHKIETISNNLDKLIRTKTEKIDKLNEYKKSLIYEYVTGKKEVC